MRGGADRHGTGRLRTSALATGVRPLAANAYTCIETKDGLYITRYACAGTYEILEGKDRVLRGRFRLVGRAPDDSASQRAAIGYVKRCDAFVLDVDPQHLEVVPDFPDEFIQRARVEAFLDRLLTSDVLRERANSFGIGDSWQSSLAMLTATALRQRAAFSRSSSAIARAGAPRPLRMPSRDY